MRLVVLLSLAYTIVGSGCGTSVPAPAMSTLSAEKQEGEAARVFEVARAQEKERQAQAAVAAYKHILRDFPRTPHAKKASDRIKVLQREKSVMSPR